MRKCIIVILSLVVFSCTTYTSRYILLNEDKSEHWFSIGKEGAGDAAVMISLLNDKPSARIILYSKGKKLSSIKDIDISLTTGQSDSLEVSWKIADGQESYLTGPQFKSLFSQILNTSGTTGSDEVYLTCSRRYQFNDLPEKLDVKFHITTSDTTVSGVVPFKKIVTKSDGVLRWH